MQVNKTKHQTWHSRSPNNHVNISYHITTDVEDEYEDDIYEDIEDEDTENEYTEDGDQECQETKTSRTNKPVSTPVRGCKDTGFTRRGS